MNTVSSICSSAVPCTPTNITAAHKCAPDPVPVSWAASNGAKYYTAVAVSSRGYGSECVTNTTSCDLPGLQCGDVYTIGVSGANGECTSLLSNKITVVTGNNNSQCVFRVIKK